MLYVDKHSFFPTKAFTCVKDGRLRGACFEILPGLNTINWRKSNGDCNKRWSCG